MLRRDLPPSDYGMASKTGSQAGQARQDKGGDPPSPEPPSSKNYGEPWATARQVGDWRSDVSRRALLLVKDHAHAPNVVDQIRM